MVQKNQYSDEESDEAEVENDPEEETVNLTESSKVAEDNLIVGDETHADAAYPVGTYIEWFVVPTPDYPDGYQNTFNLDKTMVSFFASLPENESKTAERQMVEGEKLGLEPLDVFHQIVVRSSYRQRKSSSEFSKNAPAIPTRTKLLCRFSLAGTTLLHTKVSTFPCSTAAELYVSTRMETWA